MEIFVNDEAFDIERVGSESIGDLLSKADALLEKAGAVIVALSLDGRSIGPDELAVLGPKPATETSRLEIVAESSSEYRSRATRLLLDILGEALPLPDEQKRRKLGQSLSEIAESIGGIFPADELALINSLEEEVRIANSRGSEDETLLAEQIATMEGIFRERLAELSDPVAEFRRASGVYQGASEKLRELPVWLQTGKEKQAMQAVLVFVGLFDKVIRLMPLLGRKGVDTGAILVEGLELPAFYASFNDVLAELAKAISDHDSVLIGDLSEYEVVPRMEGLFAAIGGALPA